MPYEETRVIWFNSRFCSCAGNRRIVAYLAVNPIFEKELRLIKNARARLRTGSYIFINRKENVQMIKTHDDVCCYLMDKGFHVESEYFMAPISKWKYTLSKDGITRFYWHKRGFRPTESWADSIIADFNSYVEIAKIQASSTALRGDMIHGYSYLDTNEIDYMKNDMEAIMNYCTNKTTPIATNTMSFINTCGIYMNIKNGRTLPEIDRVIFNDPATIVIWKDGTKTVVKASNEYFDPEKGLAMAIAKKAMGNTGKYFNEIKKWTEPYEAEQAWEGEFNVDIVVTEAFKTFVCSALGLDKDTKSEE